MPYLPDSGFQAIAPVYDRLAKVVFGSALEQAQAALLPCLPPQGRVLLIGGGSGWLLEQLLRTGKNLHILYLDAAPAMVALAQKRYALYARPHACTVTFRVGTEQALLLHEQFEVIFTPFLLDLFPSSRLAQLMARLSRALIPQGQWLFADFWPEQQPVPWWQQFLIWAMYLFFGAVSGVQARQLPDYHDQFEALGFREIYSRPFYKGMVQAKIFRRA
ncbi:class I SAM-dependent methyltransferase [Pontibacter sp. CAU 1760]